MEKQKKMALTEEEKSTNIIDSFVYLVAHWKWFVLSILLPGGYPWYNYCEAPSVCNHTAIIMIKTLANSWSVVQLSNADFIGRVSVASGILQFKSKELIRRVIDRLHVDVSYMMRDGLRPREFYVNSPIRVAFLEVGLDEVCSLSVIPKSKQQVGLADFSLDEFEQQKTVNLNNTVDMLLEELIVFTIENYSESYFGRPIKVTSKSWEGMVAFWFSDLTIGQMSGDAALLSMTTNNLLPTRTTDVLDMLITVYNEEAIRGKNHISVNTAKFTKERLQIIEHGLGSVEADVRDLKRTSNGVDINTVAGMYVQDSRQYKSSIEELGTRPQLVLLIEQYLQNLNKNDELIPGNIELPDLSIEGQISRYSEMLLRHNHLISGSSSSNPVVQELNRITQTMKQNIYMVTDNLSKSLRLKKQDYMRQESRVRRRV